jgi:hypothetical protein
METISKIRPIWLVQRAGIPTPLADTNATLTNSLNLEYMGSAEFEFGALPKSLRHLRSAHEQGNMVIRLVPDILQGESPLRVLSAFDDDSFLEYTKELNKLRYENPRTKECTRFQHDYGKMWGPSNTEFWWDIDNDAMWSFNKRYMNRLVSYLENSFKVLKRP